MIFQFLVRLRTYSVSFVSSVVENVACLLVYNQMVTDVHHRGTERTEDSQRRLLFYYPLDTVRSLKNDIRSRRSLDLLPVARIPSYGPIFLFYPRNFEIIETDGHIAFRLSSRI
jgi:hypothetical protein